jgi:hypothetical protein
MIAGLYAIAACDGKRFEILPQAVDEKMPSWRLSGARPEGIVVGQ